MASNGTGGMVTDLEIHDVYIKVYIQKKVAVQCNLGILTLELAQRIRCAWPPRFDIRGRRSQEAHLNATAQIYKYSGL
jgi:hypothetical protein